MYDTGVQASVSDIHGQLLRLIEELDHNIHTDNTEEQVLLERLRIAAGHIGSVSIAIDETILGDPIQWE